MTRTIVASATEEVVIGFDQPFCVIGERINPTGRKKLAAEMIEGNFETVERTRWRRSRRAPPCSTSMPA
jgi:5-methyltetrahydrofolate--homocysteine methyltransferase